MEINELFGLPAHPLLVHLPIVLLPLCAVGAIGVVISDSWRHRIGWIVTALTGVSLVFVQLAIGSGESLEERVEETGSRELIEDHSQLAEQLRPFVVLFFLALLGYMLWAGARDRRQAAAHRAPAEVGGNAAAENAAAAGPAPAPAAGPGWLDIGLRVAVGILAIVSLVGIVRTGHSGADATWHDTPTGEAGESGE